MANVDYVRKEVTEARAEWDTVRVCVEGAAAVRRAGDAILPRPEPEDKSAENGLRYDAYQTRAIFYNVTKRTHEGLVGTVFTTDPKADIPDTLKPVMENADGAGVGLEQLAKKALGYIVDYGRAGVLLDFPQVGDRAITQAELNTGTITPLIGLYDPYAIINWRTAFVDGQVVLTLVVLHETYDAEDDGYATKVADQWRELRLTEEGTYVQKLWRKDATGSFVQEGADIVPTDASGQPLTFIPFVFIGSVTNTESIDPAPLYDMAVINLGHYRNSADYEESCFVVGQPTPWFSGLTQQWVEEYFKNGEVRLGSRTAVVLPLQGAAGLLQAEPNTLPKEAMDHKERQMVALGAKLVENRETARTLGEARMEQAAENSVLGNCAKNVSAALTATLRWGAEYFYRTTSGLENIWYTLPTDFAISRMSPEERMQLMKEWQGGAISFTEYRDQLRQSGIATLDDEKAKDEMETDPPPALDPVADPEEDDDGSDTPPEPKE